MRARVLVLLALGAGILGCRPREPVMAKVGNLSITESEFRRKLDEVAQNYRSYVLTPNGRRQFLEILIREKMILAAARASEIPRSSEFRSQMDRLRADEEDRVREGRDYLLTRLWIEDLRQKGVLKSSEDEVKDYYRKHPVEVRVRNILVAGPEDAEAIANKARRGANFGLLAKANSLEAATASDGGKMEPAIYGEIIPDLEDVVFRMRTGEISGPLKSKFGYHVLKKESERKLTYEEARDRVARLLEKQKLDRYLQSIQEKFPVEVVDEQFK